MERECGCGNGKHIQNTDDPAVGSSTGTPPFAPSTSHSQPHTFSSAKRTMRRPYVSAIVDSRPLTEGCTNAVSSSTRTSHAADGWSVPSGWSDAAQRARKTWCGGCVNPTGRLELEHGWAGATRRTAQGRRRVGNV
eukprot:146481-Chlamydomonas_euryale.AAC.4